jgi:hypothetical protein
LEASEPYSSILVVLFHVHQEIESKSEVFGTTNKLCGGIPTCGNSTNHENGLDFDTFAAQL